MKINEIPPDPMEKKFKNFTEKIDNQRRRFAVKFLIAFAFLGFTVALSVYYVYTTTADNKTGLCALRADAEERIRQYEDFIRNNPNGIPGISNEVLERSAENSRRTRDALKDLNCEGVA